MSNSRAPYKLDDSTKYLKLRAAQLVAVLKEVHYLQSRTYDNIPAGACELYLRRDELRKYVINLDLIVHFYNKIRQTVLEVEYPLVENQLSDIDHKLLQAENSLTWNSTGTDVTHAIIAARCYA